MRAARPILAAGTLACALAAAAALAPFARAHGPNPAVAWLNDPVGVENVVDEQLTFTWVDADIPIPTGTATVDFFYTANRPPAYTSGDIHPLLEGTPIVQGIIEKDLDNTYTWDTSEVPAGTYHLWSMVIEPPEPEMSPQIIDFSPGLVTVAHPGDPVYPGLILITPDTAFRFADESYLLKWSAFDPDGTGRVTFEAGTSSMGEDFSVIAEDLPAGDGEFLWDTSGFEEADWYIRATIADERGLSFSTYARYVLLITHDVGAPDSGVPPPPDAGTTRPDAGARAPDSGVEVDEPPSGCRAAAGADAAAWALLALALSAGRRARRRRGARGCR